MSTAVAEPTAVRAALPAQAPWRVFQIAGIAVFLVSLDATVVIAGFPAFRRAFPAVGVSDLSWILNAYTIVYAALLVPSGRLADLVGRRRIFLQGLALFTLGSLLCGASPSPALLIASRVLQAAGAALLTPASLALILNAFPVERRAIAVSLWGALGGLAAALGPALGSWLIERTSWHWIFLINLPIGVLTMALARRNLEESKSPETGARPDVPGIALIMAAVGAIALGCSKSNEWGGYSPLTWSVLGAGILLTCAFVAWARGKTSAALDLTLFDDRTYRYVNLATFVFGVAFTMMFLTFFLFVTGVWHYSQSLAGIAVTPGPLMVIPTAIVAGRVAAKRGHRPLLVPGGVLYAIANGWYALRLGAQSDYLRVWLPGQLMGGTAVGLLLPSLAGAAVANLGPRLFGVGSAVNNAIRQIGSVIGAAVCVAMVGAAGSDLSAFKAVYWLLAGLGLATGLISVGVRTRPRAAMKSDRSPAPQAGALVECHSPPAASKRDMPTSATSAC
jgi:EmrB/QacA subfamily drug resistance transporter